MSTYYTGYREALTSVGLEKLANPVARWLAQKAPGFLHNFRVQTFGQPIKAFQQLRAGTLMGKGGLVRQGLSAPGLLNKTLLYGIPAGMAAYTAAGDDPDKYEQIGGLATGALMGNAAFGPLGMMGAMAAMPVGSMIGRHAGGAVRHLATGEPSQASGAVSPLHHQYVPMAGMVGSGLLGSGMGG
jgi:hypothetical protein